MTIGIYEIKHLQSDKRYIGQSVQVEYRLNKHKATLLKRTHINFYLQRAYDKYDVNDFSFKLILECRREDLDFYEDLIIKGYKSNCSAFGYNLRDVNSNNAGILTTRNKNLFGKKFNRLTFIKPTGVVGDKGRWYVKCDCGNIVIQKPTYVKSGHTKSCGCWNIEALKNRSRKRK